MLFARTVAVWLVVAFILGASLGGASAASFTIDGSKTNQYVDGLGVNANYWSYTNHDLEPVLDALIDQAGMTLFRVVFNNGWEATNDNSDSTVMNQPYYNALYAGPEFEKLWGLIGYLNQKGISNGIVLNFQGPGPNWMGGGSLTAGMEDEWAEMIVSLLAYARNNRQLQFNLVAPDNEPDIGGEGIYVATAQQYVTMLEKLAAKLDANGLGDFRLVVPDRSNWTTNFFPEIMADPAIMAKVAHFGFHSYSGGGTDSAGVSQFVNSTAFADRKTWVTEYNVWCESCERGGQGTNGWDYFRETADYLLDHLANGASAGLVWEAYDSYYPHHNAWSFWGLFAVDSTNAIAKTYTPRKNFYTLAQISKFVRPGARRIGLTGTQGPLWIDVFYHDALGQLTLTGINTSSNPQIFSGSLASLPSIASLDFYYTSSTTNLAQAASAAITNHNFSLTVPPDCIFTLTGFDPARLLPPPVLTISQAGNSLTFSWPSVYTAHFLEMATNLNSLSQWTTVTNLRQTVGQEWQVNLSPTGAQQFFRLRQQ